VHIDDHSRDDFHVPERYSNAQIFSMMQIAVGLDKRFAGIVEAWASGISWQELIEHSGMDEGDVARLLRQTLDLVSQVLFYHIAC